MAASSLLKSKVDEMTTCPLCFEDFTSPRILPCLHSFCLKCLQGHCKDEEPGDDARCSLCRAEFTIPQNGAEDLKFNFNLQGLVDIKRASGSKAELEETPGRDSLEAVEEDIQELNIRGKIV